MLPCKHQIICAPMNKVSDLRLAKAVYDAGCFPSFVIYNYKDLSELENDIREYVAYTGAANCILALDMNALTPNMLSIIEKYKISHLEILSPKGSPENSSPPQETLQQLKTNNVKVFLKISVTNMHLQIDNIVDEFTGFVIKSDDAAARIGMSKNMMKLNIMIVKRKYPNIKIISSGGIGEYSDVKRYMDYGADAVSLGTLFAVSEESKISEETKLKMISSTFENTKVIGVYKQNSLIFSDISGMPNDDNHTQSLKLGVKSPNSGLIFMGAGINKVDRIKTVKEIVEELTKQ